jgi:alpha-L-rhamnosidase
VTLGATTMWERWDGWTPDKGFQDPGMNSFNHYAFGAVGEFLFTDVGGIRNDGIGFKNIIIAPHPGGGLTYANTSYNSIRGKIVSNWKIDGKTFTLEVVVPPNVTAKVRVPASDPKAVTNSDLAHAQPQAAEEGAAVFAVQPGRYLFTSALP